MTNFAELLRLIHNLIRLGTIDQVDHDSLSVRVKIGDNMTGWLRWMSFRAGTTRDWDPPTVGEQVIIFSPGGDLAAGVVLTGLNSDTYSAPSADPGIWMREFPDGAVVQYDHENSELTLTLPGNAKVTAPEGITFTANIAIDGELQVSGNTTFDGGSVKHQGKEIGKSHKHAIASGSSAPGPTNVVQ